jgi:putative N6-adenine-specific DNA methylase
VRQWHHRPRGGPDRHRHGIRRRFGFEALRGHDASAWKQLQTEARQGVRSAPAQAIVASDRSREAVSDLRASLEHFGLGEAVRSSVADVSRATAPCPSGVWLTNPPYGVRLGADEDLTALFRSVGTTLKQQFAGWHCYFISADMTLPRQLGLKESRRTPLYNGRLECRLFEFRMFQGSLRPRS